MAQHMSVLGIDMATQVGHVAGMADKGHVVLRKRLARGALLTFIANVPPLRIGMDAGGRAQAWARRFREPGHDVRLIAPHVVNASVKSPKHEARAAEAIGEAVTRPAMRVVPMKRMAPQDLQALPRSRARLINARTAWAHESRGLRSADGRALPHRLAQFRALIVERREADQAKWTPLSTAGCWPLDAAFLAVEKRLASGDEQLTAMGQAHPAWQRLPTIPGIGPASATALIAALGDAPQLTNGRQLAAWPGVVPREHAAGGPPRRLGIRPRGARSRRPRLIHGARATRRGGATKGEARSPWLSALIARRGENRAAVALAHTNARIAWALLAHTDAYHVRTVVATCCAAAVLQDSARPCQGAP